MTATRRRVPLAVLLGVLLLGFSFAGTFWALQSQAQDPAGRTAPAADTDRPLRAVCIAYVDFPHGVTPLYPLQPNRVKKVVAREGDVAKKGDILVELDDTAARTQRAQAKADLASAELQVKQAENLKQQHAAKIDAQKQVIEARKAEAAAAAIVRDKAQRLRNEKPPLIPEEDYKLAAEKVNGLEKTVAAEEANLRALEGLNTDLPVERARQDVAAKQAQLEKAQFAVDECKIVAPFDGKVLRVRVAEGESLGPNPRHAAVEFGPVGKRIVRAEVEQEFAPRVRLDQAAVIEDDSTRTGRKWSGKVKRLSDWYTHRRSIVQEPLQFNDVRTMECIIELDDDEGLRIGQRVRVTLGGA